MGVSNLSNNKRHSTFISVHRSRMYTQVCDPSLIPSPTRPEQTNFRRGGGRQTRYTRRAVVLSSYIFIKVKERERERAVNKVATFSILWRISPSYKKRKRLNNVVDGMSNDRWKELLGSRHSDKEMVQDSFSSYCYYRLHADARKLGKQQATRSCTIAYQK